MLLPRAESVCGGVCAPGSTLRTNAFARLVGFSTTTLAAVMMNGVYQALYVQVYLEQYKLPHYWFYIGHMLYMVWNAINDPLFAWVQERASRMYTSNQARHAAIISCGGPAFALSFLLPWFPWGKPGGPWVILHFLLAMFAWDGMFTYVLLAHAALFADIDTSNAGRSSTVVAIQVASIIASIAPFVAYFLYDPDEMWRFRAFCVAVAAVATLCFWITGHLAAKGVPADGLQRSPRPSTTPRTAVTRIDSDPRREHDEEAALLMGTPSKPPRRNSQDDDDDDELTADSGCWQGVRVGLKLLRRPDLLRVIAVNFCQTFNCTANSNFHPMLLRVLVGTTMASGTVNTALGISQMLPFAVALALALRVRQDGTSYYVLRGLFVVKLIMCGAMSWMGMDAPATVLLFVALHGGLATASSQFIPMSFGDVIDQERIDNNRKRSQATMIFGLNALMIKPAQSLAPMVVVWILSKYGYHSTSAIMPDTDAVDTSSALIRHAAFHILYGIPAVCAMLQLAVWSGHTLRGPQPDARQPTRTPKPRNKLHGRTSSDLDVLQSPRAADLIASDTPEPVVRRIRADPAT